MKLKLFFITATTIITVVYSTVTLAKVCGGRKNAANVTGCSTCTTCSDIKVYIKGGCSSYYTNPDNISDCGDNQCQQCGDGKDGYSTCGVHSACS